MADGNLADLGIPLQIKPSVGKPSGDFGASDARALAADFSEVGRKVGELADTAATAEGRRDGAQAGLDPEFRPSNLLTLRGRAFDEAGIQIAQTKAKIGLNNDLQTAFDQYKYDPTRLQQELNQRTQAWISGAFPEMRPHLTLDAQASSLALMRDSTRIHIQQVQADQRAAFDTDVADSVKQIHQRAFAMGLDPAADAISARDIDGLSQVLVRKGVDGAPLMGPNEAKQVLRKATEQVSTSRLLGAFDRLQSMPERIKFLDDFKADFAAGRGVAKVYDINQFEHIERTLRYEMHAAHAADGQAAAGLTHDIGQIEELAKNGISVPPDQVAALHTRAIMSGHPELIQNLARAQDNAEVITSARRGTPDAIAALAAEYRRQAGYAASQPRDGVTGADGDTSLLHGLEAKEHQAKLLDDMAAKAEHGLKTNLLGWYGKNVTSVPPLDMRNPVTFAKSIGARVPAAENAAAYYGREPQYLMPDEKAQLIAAAAPGGRELLDVAGAIAAGAPKTANKVLAEISKDAPTLAVAGALVNLSPDNPPKIANDIANGVSLTRTKDFKGQHPSDADARMWAAAAHGGALLGAPATEQAMINATNYAYAIRMQGQGDNQKADVWKQAFREVAGERNIGGNLYGGFASYRGASIVVPPDVKKDAIGDLVGAIEPKDFGANPPLTKKGPATLQDLRQARLETVGNGQYRVNVGSVDAPAYLADHDGRNFVLDLNALKPALVARRPDLYVDGVGRPRPAGTMRVSAQ